MTDEPTDEALENLFVEETGFDPDDFPAAIFGFVRAGLAKWGTPAQAEEPVAREQLTDEQIQDLLLCGNPTDEEMRLIRIGWDAARGIKGGQHGTE